MRWEYRGPCAPHQLVNPCGAPEKLRGETLDGPRNQWEVPGIHWPPAVQSPTAWRSAVGQTSRAPPGPRAQVLMQVRHCLSLPFSLPFSLFFHRCRACADQRRAALRGAGLR